MKGKRQGNNPKRRIAAKGTLNDDELNDLVKKVSYAGSGHHKRNPADYGFERTNPRPTKSLCDLTKEVPLKRASKLLKTGISAEMLSDPSPSGFPKFIWCVDDDDTVYEAKTDPKDPGAYHGYPLEPEDAFRAYVLAEWKKRCR